MRNLLTWILLQGLRGKADLNGDGRITAKELESYVYREAAGYDATAPVSWSAFGDFGLVGLKDTNQKLRESPAPRGFEGAATAATEQVQSTSNAGHNYALLIASDHYDAWPQLKNPIKDATDVESELTKYYGFDAIEVFDKKKAHHYRSDQELLQTPVL